MKKIRYTPDAADKLRRIKNDITVEYGDTVSKKIMKSIVDSIDGLLQFETKGVEVAKLFDVDTDYRYIVNSHNYIFYRIEDKYIKIINIYHEREDFMRQLFGIVTTSDETIAYWNE